MMPSFLEDYLATRDSQPAGAVPLPKPRPPEASRVPFLSEYLSQQPSLTKEAPKSFLEEYQAGKDTEVTNPPKVPDQPAPPPPSQDVALGEMTSQTVSAGLSEANRQDAIIRSSVKSLLSGKGFGPDPNEVKLDPEPLPPAIKEYADKPVSLQNVIDPKWWLGRAVYPMFANAPAMAAGAAGMAVGGVPGGMLGAGLAGGSFSAYPNYRSGLERGLTPHEAASEAIKLSILHAGGEAASWGAFGVPLFGKVAKEAAAGVVGDVLKYPFLEAVAQIGGVQPLIGAAEHLGASSVTGTPYTPIEFTTDWVTGMGTGMFQYGLFHGASVAGRKIRSDIQAAKARGMTDEELVALHGRSIEPFMGPLSVPTHTRLSEIIDRHPLDKRPASDWLADLTEGVADRDLYNIIPKWAIDKDGNVSKENLRAALQDRYTVTEELPLQGRPERDVGFFTPGENIVNDPTDRNLRMTVRLLDGKDANGRKAVALMDLTSMTADAWAEGGVPSFFRYLADNGIHQIIYDRAHTGPAFEKFANRLGLDQGITTWAIRGEPNKVASYVDIDARANTDFGLPLSPEPVPKGPVSIQYVPAKAPARNIPGAGIQPGQPPIFRGGSYTPSELRPAARRIIKIISDWHSRFKLTLPISIKWHERFQPQFGRGTAGVAEPFDDRIVLHIMGSEAPDAASLYTTLSHEFGHALVFERMRQLPATEYDAIIKMFGAGYAGYERGFRTEMQRSNPQRLAELDKDHQAYRDELANYANQKRTEKDTSLLRDPAVHAFWRGRRNYDAKSAFTADWYWRDFQEWIANQVSKWATTDEKPLSSVDQTFSALGKQIRDLNELMGKETGRTFDPQQSIQDWVTDFIGQNPWTFHQIFSKGQQDGMMANRAALIAAGGSGNGAVPQSATGGGGRKLITRYGNRILGGSFAADGDRINSFYSRVMGLTQMVLMNPSVRGLLMYRGVVKLRDQIIKETWDRFYTGMKTWERLGEGQGQALSGLWYDYMLQTYRSQAEVQKSHYRMPTAAEFQQIVQKNGVGAEAMKLFEKQKEDFDYILKRAKELKRQEILKVADPTMQAKALEDLDLKYEKMANQPYFPMMRFGKFTWHIKDEKTGKLLRFETAETQAGIDRIEKEWQKTKLPGEVSERGILPPDSEPFFGLPPDLLDTIAAKTSVPRDLLDQLRLDYSPVNSFAHHFRYRDRTPGWSMDFKRVYASYGMTSSRWLANLEYAPTLESMIAEVRDSAKKLPVDAEGVRQRQSREQLANFMDDHFRELMNPTQDIAWLRGGLFHWYLGLAPVKALVNLSQVLIGSYPFMAQHFGDMSSIGALARNGADFRNYHKSGHYENMTEPKMRAIAEGIRQSTLTEGQAVALAGMRNYDNLAPYASVRGSAAAILKKMGEFSSFMFDTSEKFNRRITFGAAWDLATKYSEAAGVREARDLNPFQHQRLLDRGWTEKEANAFVYAQHAVDQTQYVYAPYERPRIFRGKLGSLFAFKNFTQNTLFMLGHYPGLRLRSLLMLGMMGGVMGLPGAEDISGLIKGLAYKLLGKDFDVEEQTRRWTEKLTDGSVDPDLILHGLSRHGFGIPQLAAMMGLKEGNPYPEQPGKPWRGFDLSASLGMGRIAPMDFGRLMRPTHDREGPILDAIQQALGPGFGFPLMAYRSLTASQYNLTDYKRWEKMMPLAIKDASQAWRWYHEEEERDSQGRVILRFDPSEPLHMAEIFGKLMGFNPARLTEQYDRMRDEGEAIAKWEIEQQMLTAQFGRAVLMKDEEARKKVLGAIRDFNAEVRGTSARMYAITPEMLQKSIQARATNKAKREQGIPLHRRDIPIVRDIQSLHPGASIVTRKPVD